MAFLFKNGEQLYNEGLDMIGRRDFSGAKKKFVDAIQKGYRADGMADVYITILDVGANRSSIGCYKSLRNALGNLTVGSFKFGLTDIDVNDLIAEVELDIKEIEANNLPDSLYKEKSAALIACAGEYMGRIGEKNLKLDEIFKGTTAATGSREALILQAEGYYVLGEGCVSEDPKMASEYMQMGRCPTTSANSWETAATRSSGSHRTTPGPPGAGSAAGPPTARASTSCP